MISRAVTLAILFFALSTAAFAQQSEQARHKYFFRAVYTPEGMKDLQRRSATALRAGVQKFDESAGCKLEAWYFDYTESANYGFVDCPDEIAMATISATANAAGFVRVTFKPVLTPEEMDKALAKSVATRPPQQQ
jgi:uncharacterized protein with GYD domain